MDKLNIEEGINNYIEKYSFKNMREFDHNERFASWHFCFNELQKHLHEKERLSDDNNDVQYLSLHLAMYLASWGMMRGSTALIHKSYRIHSKAIHKIWENRELLMDKAISNENIYRIFT